MIEVITVGSFATNCLLVYDAPGGEALVVDPGAESARILARVAELDLSLREVLLTHGHGDHLGAARQIQEATGVRVSLSERDLSVAREVSLYRNLTGEDYRLPEDLGILSEGGEVPYGRYRLLIWELPGHTPGGLGFLGPGFLLSGDTLFAGTVGRTDLPGGDAETLRESLRRLLVLPPETRVYPGHGPPTSLGHERMVNPFLAGLP